MTNLRSRKMVQHDGPAGNASFLSGHRLYRLVDRPYRLCSLQKTGRVAVVMPTLATVVYYVPTGILLSQLLAMILHMALNISLHFQQALAQSYKPYCSPTVAGLGPLDMFSFCKQATCPPWRCSLVQHSRVTFNSVHQRKSVGKSFLCYSQLPGFHLACICSA